MSIGFEGKMQAVGHAKRDTFVNTLNRFHIYKKDGKWFYSVSLDRINQEGGELYETWSKSATKYFYCFKIHKKT